MKKITALLLALVMVLSMAACGNDPDSTQPTTLSEPISTPDEATKPSEDATEAPTGESADATEPSEPYVPEIGEGIYSKISYTTDNDTLLQHCDDVVATVGEEEMTMGQLQAYYWMYVYSFLNEYGYYLNYIGLDLATPLDQQACPESDGTWQQYFLSEALSSWHANQSLALAGEAQQVPLSDDVLEQLETMDQEMKTAAEEGEYASVEEMLLDTMGPGVTLAGYKAYLDDYYAGYSFYNHSYDTMQVTDDMIEAFFYANRESLAENGITKESGKAVDIRHILLSPKGGTTDEEGNTTYSDAEWKKCEEEAQKILDQWLAGEKTEESFAALANEHSTDPGSNTNGGLYQGVVSGDMVEEFNDWCFDNSRKVGDYGLVKTTFGYHIMFYSADEIRWIAECREGAKNEKLNEIVTAAGEAYPLTVDYEKLMVGHMDLVATE